MTFAGILSGEYVVWHNRIAQIDAKLTPVLPSLNKVEMVVGVNKYNQDNYIRVFYKTSAVSPFIFLKQMALAAPVECPADGSFIDAVYSCTFGAVSATEIRFVVTKDGVNPKELTPIKKYRLFNNGVLVVGGSTFEVNPLGWQTGEVFKTIFTYLEAPISVEHKVNIETETEGLLPENRIRNDNLLARLNDNELITGNWSFENGQMTVPKGTVLPLMPVPAGRIFYNTAEQSFFISDGTNWQKLIKENDLLNKIDFVWGFTRPSSVPPGSYLKFGDTPLSAEDGMPLPATCKLTGAIVYVPTKVFDGSGIEILKNGVVVAAIAVTNGTKMGESTPLSVVFNYKDFVAVRARATNASSLDYPRVSLLFKSV